MHATRIVIALSCAFAILASKCEAFGIDPLLNPGLKLSTRQRGRRRAVLSSRAITSLAAAVEDSQHQVAQQLTDTKVSPDEVANGSTENLFISSLLSHHTAVKTRDIEASITFYSLLGFDVETKFRSGPARAAWLTNANPNDSDNEQQKRYPSSRIELIEVPSYMLQEEKGTRKRALDLAKNEALLGINHLALDVTACIQQIKTAKLNANQTIVDEDCGCTYGLAEFMDGVNAVSLKSFGKSLRVAMPPRQQIIGKAVYEIAFLYDPDGALLELLYWTKNLDIQGEMLSGWEPWDGKGFAGATSSIDKED
mmetsp:Transcript_20677/g.30432  ORF Transcript_20677/g.30432 Transcript_20677/m.30432 type:complete len:310 (+) Transcript_20677:19-948(+)